jgi:hypothetical protein
MAEQYKVLVECVAADMSRAEQVTQMIVEVERNLGVAVGGARAAACAAIMPLAPALLSTTTACLVCSVTDWPSARASW